MTARKRSTRLDIKDLPRDPQRAISTLRSVLVRVFNYVRTYPAKLAVLEETLRVVHKIVRDAQKEAESLAAARAKAAEIASAEALEAANAAQAAQAEIDRKLAELAALESTKKEV